MTKELQINLCDMQKWNLVGWAMKGLYIVLV